MYFIQYWLLYLYQPANTLDEPELIAPASAESPFLAIAIPSANTEPDPALITAVCGTQEFPAGIVCTVIGSPFLQAPMPLTNTVDDPTNVVVVESHP